MTRLLLSAAAAALLVACSGDKEAEDKPAAPVPAETSSTQAPSAEEMAAMAEEDARLATFLDAKFEEQLALSPEFQTYLGRKTNTDKWDERTDEADERQRELLEAQLAEMQDSFDRDALSPEGQLNYDLFTYDTENSLALDNFRLQRFSLTQFRGIHSNIPVFLANYHKVDTFEDAVAYVARVRGVPEVLDQAATQMEDRIAGDFPLPEFSYPLIAETARSIADGEAILEDFSKKMEALDAPVAEKDQLELDLLELIEGPFAAAYEDFATRVETMGDADVVDGNYGVGRFQDGEAYYNALLSNYTTTDLTAEEIHQLGLAEVARIQDEMRAIMAQVGFEGTLQEFFDFMREDEQFYLPNTDEGREAYLELARDYIVGMKVKLSEQFGLIPAAPVEVRRVEPYRERAAGKAFYNQPAPDGSRPGIFYANLAKMEDMPTYQLEALVYHEAIPGHHMQRALQIEQDGLPLFRRFGGYTAYTEGWGLYSELLPKEIGFYEDPYSDFGRLAMELWRAARLVVDTGLHAKGWEMQEAIDYLQENTPNPDGDTVKAIERYIVYPGQATAYKIGMLRILELREAAKAELGDDFDIRGFHDTVLAAGPLPLSVLEGQIDAWVARQKAE
ncbi:DUF885 family protein [Parvularcula marina]|uniref:DUF885 domain-containing protein n=1 Tax=Parvularcula marina TaxID=2292771 RepID=UPI0035176721